MPISTTSPSSTFDIAADTTLPSTIADGYMASSKPSLSSNVTEVCYDPPTLSLGLSYNMTNVPLSFTNTSPFLLGKMVMACGHFVTILSYSPHPITASLQCAVLRTTGDIFIMSSTPSSLSQHSPLYPNPLLPSPPQLHPIPLQNHTTIRNTAPLVLATPKILQSHHAPLFHKLILLHQLQKLSSATITVYHPPPFPLTITIMLPPSISLPPCARSIRMN